MGHSRTVRTATANNGGISRQHDIRSGGWTVLFQSTDTGEVELMAVPYDSKKSVRQLLKERGIDIEDAIVERVR